MSSTAPLLRAHNAEQLATAATALASDQHGQNLAVAAKALADSARAFADSPGDSDAAARLADAAAVFTQVSTDNAPQAPDETNAVVLAAAQFLPGRHDWRPSRPSDDRLPNKLLPRSARALGTAAALLAAELRGTALAVTARAFADSAREFAGTTGDWKAAAKLTDASRVLAAAAAGTPQADTVSHLLQAVDTILRSHQPRRARSCFDIALCCFSPGESMVYGDKKPLEEDVGPTPALLEDQACRFADAAAGTSMTEAAVAFSQAVQNFASRKEKKNKTINSELNKAANILCAAAMRAPESEFDLAAAAVSMTEDSQFAWISEYSRIGLRRRGWWASWRGRFRAAISGPEPMLPVHRDHAERQSKLIDKRQVLFGIALGAPVALLISAVATSIFPPEYAPWIGGTTVLVWIVVSVGMVANQYGKTNVELQAASHLSRLGMLGLSVLLGIYAYWAFFPFSRLLFWVFVVLPLGFHGCLWIASCIRGDDKSISMSRAAEETEASGFSRARTPVL